MPQNTAEKFTTYKQAYDYVLSTVPAMNNHKFTGTKGIKRMNKLLDLIGRPDKSFKHIVHVAGTSGKGSTSYLTSEVLRSQGYRVGLTVSPHLFDIRERAQINGEMISKIQFTETLNEILTSIETIATSSLGQPTYFEIMVAIALKAFANEHVDIAVLETGLGGLLDGTNAVDPSKKICVLTTMGLDHERVLGDTLPLITTQKAGIIHLHNKVIINQQSSEVMSVVRKQVKDNKAELIISKPSKSLQTIVSGNTVGQYFDYYQGDWELLDLKLGMVGEFQIRNAYLALGVLQEVLKSENKPLEESSLRSSLSKARFAGRFDIINLPEKKTVIFDGAHNDQKIAGLCSSVSKIFEQQNTKFLYAGKKGSTNLETLRQISGIAGYIYITSFPKTILDYQRISDGPDLMSKFLDQLDYKNYEIIADQKEAFQTAMVTLKPNEVLVVTGSLYLLASLSEEIRGLKEKYQ